MKMSEAILKGMERYPDPAGAAWNGKNGACAIGCANFAVNGHPHKYCDKWDAVNYKFMESFGIGVIEANDRHICREDIAGMLMAIGE